MANGFDLNLAETVIVFIGIQFAGYATSRSIDQLTIGDEYRLLILWMITSILLVPVLIIKRRHTDINKKQVQKIVKETVNVLLPRMDQLNSQGSSSSLSSSVEWPH